MAISSLDTHEIVKDLKAAGFTDEQAEAVTRAVKQAQDVDLSNLATKTDLAELRTELAELRAGTKADLAELRRAYQVGRRCRLRPGCHDPGGTQVVSGCTPLTHFETDASRR
jgi:hypothetical protein